MSYQNWANYGWMIPATFENARLLGMTDEQMMDIFGEKDTVENPHQDWWDEVITEYAYDNVEFDGTINGKNFTVCLTYISGDDEIDYDMDSNINVYFAFVFSELYTPTPLYFDLEKIGMKHCTWVTGG